MKLQLRRKSAFAAKGQNYKDPLISSLEIEFLQITLKTMQPIDPCKEARRMNHPFLQFPKYIILSAPPIRPMVESTLSILSDQLIKYYRLIRRSVPECSQE